MRRLALWARGDPARIVVGIGPRLPPTWASRRRQYDGPPSEAASTVTIDRRTAAVLAAAVIVGLAGMRPAVVSGASFEAVEEADSRIERPMVDVHLLAPEPGERAPRLLVIDAERAAAGAIRMALLVRDRSWSEVASLDVGLRPAAGGIRPEWGLDTPWMVPLDDRSVAVIANAPGEGAAYVARV
jgi:hypothetical protein